MRFSKRMGHVSPRTELQIESMDKDLRVALWNNFWEQMESHFYGYLESDDYIDFSTKLWRDFLSLPLTNMPGKREMLSFIAEWYDKCPWYRVYDFIEFIGRFSGKWFQEEFRMQCNEVLKKHVSGYRFVAGEITQITDNSEITSIEETLDQSAELGLEGVKHHIQSALSKLSDRKEPDYRNSIKESISAVESICKLIVDKHKTTLSKALNKLENKINIHPELKKGFASIYNYTSDEEGIRHAMTEKNDCDLEDAQYMLVSCSAFVNYLIAKAQKAGIDLSLKKE